jgi:uncharacterized membrane protein
MSYQDWIFSIHLLFAATLVGGLFMSWILVFALWTAPDPEATLSLSRVTRVATGAIAIGLPGVIALGIWLALLRPQLHPWHGWAIAAIVLWAIAAAAIARATVEYAKSTRMARELVTSGRHGPSAELTALNRSVPALLFRAVGSVAIVLIVIDMVYKPGA